ncbi:CLUMA_CG015142, isoform A [Clunio marinus]|uniref:CLUMA_CG015142, isoform A n=1 Tax=Clunio marinus TaxID=568069 RepID=A0A1J1IU77_9DIPT|nr:CLUMA_CG015142, isoform A [Clunio marinus]
MSHLFPKRTSELSTMDSDLETPERRKETSPSKFSYRLPKRVVDLEFQESDSDEEKNDKLNCAILNESFVLSPSKDIEVGDTPCRKTKSPTNENDKNIQNQTLANDEKTNDSGFLSRRIVLTENKNIDESLHKLPFRQIRSRMQLFNSNSSAQETPQEKSVPSVFKTQQKHESEVVREPFSTLKSHGISTPGIKQTMSDPSDLETPLKKSEDAIFATPSVRPQSSLMSAVVKPSNPLPLPLTCEKKEKPQVKILFTTPITRPPPGSLLKSTPVESRKPPVQNQRKLSPINEPSSEKETSENISTINDVEYVMEKKLGSGGSSTVFLGRDKKTNRECAIKIVNLDGDQQVVDGYLNETKLLARLQGNVNVVSLFDYAHLPKKRILYMVMEKGESDLHKILQGFRTHIPLYTMISYWHQMLQAVHYIHQNGVIHSDLKPANFLMVEGRLKLIDFGIASNIAIDSTSIIKFSQAGTFNYISPEALIDTSTGDSPSTHHQPKIRLSTKSDVWSLGCILYLLIFKKTPFSHIKVLHQKIHALTNPNTKIEYPPMPNFYPPILVEMVFGVIYVIDSSDHSTLERSKEIFGAIMSNDLLMGKPMLILSTKQDLPGALDSLDICDYFEVEYLANLFRTPCYIEGVGRYENQYDSQVAMAACTWLVNTICNNYKSIQNKIRFLRVVTQNESLSSNEEIPRRNRRPATGKRKKKLRFAQNRPKSAPHAKVSITSDNPNFLTSSNLPPSLRAKKNNQISPLDDNYSLRFNYEVACERHIRDGLKAGLINGIITVSEMTEKTRDLDNNVIMVEDLSLPPISQQEVAIT